LKERRSRRSFGVRGFLDYTLRDDLGGERFGPFKKHQVTKRDTRGELVAAVLRANCQLVLGSFAKGQDGFDIEDNQNTNNLIFGTPFQSVGHRGPTSGGTAIERRLGTS
jgi:hypothetical protein